MTKRPNLTEAQTGRIAELRERNLSIAQIAMKIGCTEGSVSWAILAMGVERADYKPAPPPPVPTEPVTYQRGSGVVRLYTQADDAQLLALEAKGICTYAIARMIGRRNNSVLGRLRTLARRQARLELLSGEAA